MDQQMDNFQVKFGGKKYYEKIREPKKSTQRFKDSDIAKDIESLFRC